MQKLSLLLLLLFFVGTESNGQDYNVLYDKSTSQTIHLKNIKFKRVVAYKLHSVTILLSYEDYISEIDKSWTVYNEGMKSLNISKQKGEYINPDYELRWQLFDSIHSVLHDQTNLQDTFYISYQLFTQRGLANPDKLFAKLIEQNKCLVLDSSNKRQTLIIRRKGTKVREPLGSYGGKAYYLPNSDMFFIEVRDWMT